MSAIDDLFMQNFAPDLANGFALDPPEFDGLRLWTYRLYEIDFASDELKALILTRPAVWTYANIRPYLGRMYSVVTTYARIFNAGGHGVPTLDPGKVFANRPELKHVHEHLIRMRNNLTAHTGNHEMLRVAVGVKEENDKYVVKRFTMPCIIPAEDMAECAKVFAHTGKYIGARLDRYIINLEKKLGKHVEVERTT